MKDMQWRVVAGILLVVVGALLLLQTFEFFKNFLFGSHVNIINESGESWEFLFLLFQTKTYLSFSAVLVSD